MAFLLIVIFFVHQTPQVFPSYIFPQRNSKGHWQGGFLFYFEYPLKNQKSKFLLKMFRILWNLLKNLALAVHLLTVFRNYTRK